MVLVALVVLRAVLVLQVREGQRRAGREKPRVLGRLPLGTRCYLRNEPPRPAYHLSQLLVRAPEEDGRVLWVVHVPQRFDNQRVRLASTSAAAVQDLGLCPAV